MPHRLFLGRRAIEVDAVLDRWLASDHGYFKLRGSDGATYILRHDEVRRHWQLVVYRGPEAPG